MKHLYLITLCLLSSSLPAYFSYAVSVEDCVEAALNHNPGLQAAEHRVQAARAATMQARAMYYPTFFVSGNLTRTDNPTQAFMMQLNQRTLDFGSLALDPNHPDDTDNLRLSSGVRYQLYDGGTRAAQRRMAQRGVEAGAHAVEAVRNELTFVVIEGYYRALHMRAFVDVQEEALISMKESLRVARQRHEAGAITITDVLNLEVQVAQAREAWLQSQHAFAAAVNVLNTAIGFDFVEPDALLHMDEMDIPEPPDHVSPEELAKQINLHPAFQAARSMQHMRRDDVDRARSRRNPAVNLFGSLDWDSDVNSDFERSYLIGIATEWNIFDGGQRRGDVLQTRAQHAEAVANTEEVRLHLTLDWTQADLRVRDALERLAVTQASEKTAEKAWAVTREQYHAGAATLADLLTAQSSWTSMRARRTAAHYDYLVALADRARANGTLFLAHEERTQD